MLTLEAKGVARIFIRGGGRVIIFTGVPKAYHGTPKEEAFAE